MKSHFAAASFGAKEIGITDSNPEAYKGTPRGEVCS